MRPFDPLDWKSSDPDEEQEEEEMTESTQGYAVVQHSAYGYGGDGQFRKGLESRAVNAREAKAVREARGLVFPSRKQAEDYLMEEQYPGTGFYLTPRAPGSFAITEVDGLRVYVPKDPIQTKEDEE